jgi:hypothetical protein
MVSVADKPTRLCMAVRSRAPSCIGMVYAPFQTPSPVSVAVTSTIHAVKLAATVILDETETRDAACTVFVRCVTGVAP